MSKSNISRNEQEIFWSEQYAEDYIKKNAEFDTGLALQAWEKMLASTSGITSLLECGCNIGRNIDSLDRLLPSASKSIIEISKPAFEFVSNRHALSQKFNGSILESSLEGSFDLVYTMGVLIHINPDELLANLQKAYNYSNKYLLFGEYFRVLSSLKKMNMVKIFTIIEKQVYKKVTHFGGQISKDFEVFLRGHPCHIDGQFECDQSQYRSTDFHSAS